MVWSKALRAGTSRAPLLHGSATVGGSIKMRRKTPHPRSSRVFTNAERAAPRVHFQKMSVLFFNGSHLIEGHDPETAILHLRYKKGPLMRTSCWIPVVLVCALARLA